MSADPSAGSQNDGEGAVTPAVVCDMDWWGPSHAFTLGNIVQMPGGGLGVQMHNSWGEDTVPIQEG